MGVEQAYNYRELNDRVATAGRVEPEQLEQLGAAGVEVVINLMPDSSDYAVPGERDIVEGQGIEYLYLPVDFAAPTLADYESFLQLMAKVGQRKLLIHCAANWRVSAFYSRYAIDRGMWSPAEADRFMLSIWQPAEHPPWSQWLEEVACRN
ncbi:MAG: protein tyrosine phosphatase family protein [Halieaceae bacterium]|jgi:protein tyrosine phosphatase (PTP) superfamily phosphohydrolase (DUF442 family)|nr:protein tyrosine phosphatase family protein [Halieaceae bacterium]